MAKLLGRRSLASAALAVAVIAVSLAVVALAGGGGSWHPDWRLILDYLKVLVWPGVVALFLVMFRAPIAGFIGRITELDLFGAKTRLSEQELNDQANQSLRAAGAVDSPIAMGVDAGFESRDPQPREQRMRTIRELTAELIRGDTTDPLAQLQAEAWIQAGVHWGWLAHAAGLFTQPPFVVIEWNNGVPEVKYGTMSPDADAQARLDRMRSAMQSG